MVFYFTIKIIFCHGKGLHLFIRHVHADMIDDLREVLVLPRVGDAEEEGGVAILIAERLLLDVIGAAVKFHSALFEEREPLGIREMGDRLLDEVGIHIPSEGIGQERAPAVVRKAGAFLGASVSSKGLHCRNVVGAAVLIKFHGGNDRCAVKGELQVHRCADAAVDVGVRVDFGALARREWEPVRGAYGREGACHE